MDLTTDNRGDPYFGDGNVVLLTEQDGVAFKVHGGVLARHSEIFQSMFEFPQPAWNSETFDGCPVVRMHDIPLELSNLIQALYDGVEFHNRSAEDFFFLAGILRLATKYFVNRLRTQAIRHLTDIWSYTLRGHDEMISRAVNSPIIDEITYPYVHPLHVLNLAREVNILLLRPSAMFFLSLYPLADILKGDHPKLTVQHVSRPSSELDIGDMKDYTLMYQHRIDIILDFIRRVCGQREPVPDCLHVNNPCTRGFVHLSARMYRAWNIRSAPFHQMAQAMDALDEDTSICKPCRRAFRRDVIQLRKTLWSELPSVVGLPSWEELIKMDLNTQ
ncbi:hypothetical protein JAAARDRAFT_121290 [Jaapia argillacea MUCL 33604]|uniref:BTB domain-containing protein n=1 Tax=Jaapia argillacea MUCL 33604 TaxID=933084 RepID=A0A067QG96_9AGAM|nr:hypothetical protein JAAARDRAFT_121290 [Jaapia argillacea MUCL 33604]